MLRNIKRRQNLYLLYRQDKVTHFAYRRFCNYVTSSIRKAKRDYFSEKFSNYKSDMRQTWKSINHVLGKNEKAKITVSKLNINNSLVSDELLIADSFNEYFSTIGSNISNSVHHSVGSVSDYLVGNYPCLLYTSPSPRDKRQSRMPSSA